MKILAVLFFEANTEDLVVQLATYRRIPDDRAKTRDEQHPDVSHFIPGASHLMTACSRDECRLRDDVTLRNQVHNGHHPPGALLVCWPAYGSINPFRMAHRTAKMLEPAPVFPKMWDRWHAAVLNAMPRVWAISFVLRPSPIRTNTSSSRLVKAPFEELIPTLGAAS